MSNSLGAQAEKFTAMLDEIVAAEAKTADLNMNQELIGEYRGAGKVQVPKFSMDGLGDYSRANGFPAGDLTLLWEEMTLAYDRGREFEIDNVDDEERVGVVSANMFGEFVRTEVVPEVDAVRFANLAAEAGTKVSKTFSGSTAVADAEEAILAAEAAIEDAGANLSECILYTTAAFKNLLRTGCAYRFGTGENPNTNFQTFDEMKVVTVPQGRFYSAIDLYDGASVGETDGGYAKADTGKDINFMVVHPKAAAALAKHEKMRYFDPDTNQDKDAHKWQYRLYHDLLVFDNKASLVYCSKKA